MSSEPKPTVPPLPLAVAAPPGPTSPTPATAVTPAAAGLMLSPFGLLSPPAPNKGRKLKFSEKRLVLRKKLWPGVKDDDLWMRNKRDGFVTVPRGMPLMLDIMNDLSKNRPVSSTFLEIWCRSWDECFVSLINHAELALHSGFTGQRAVRTWQQRMTILDELGFIALKSGPSGQMSYALILNPYLVIRRLVESGKSAIPQDKYHALIERSINIGANELTDPLPTLPNLHEAKEPI